MRGQWVHALILIPVAWFAFFHNLGISLSEGSEGLYVNITHEMVERGDYVHLTYQGKAYANKSPFFFWILALSTYVLGENEIALRLPGSLFSLGTMALTYALGAVLFSNTAAFWAALVVAMTHVFLWYGRRVSFDSMLVFFITLALLIWVRAYFQQAGHRVMRWPGVIKPGTIVNDIMSHEDWLPTLLAAGDPDVKQKLLTGMKAGGKTFKTHLDGYNFMPSSSRVLLF